jgi:glycosyltransferase involved in cell wall biosynthesis
MSGLSSSANKNKREGLGLNVVHVVESLEVGGLERVVLSLARWQAAQGHAVRIICLFHAGALAGEAAAAGIAVAVADKSTGLDLPAVARLRRLLGPSRVDVMHTHNAVAHYYAALAAVGLRVGRIVNTRHGMSPSSGRRLRLLYRLALAGTASVAAVCQAARDEFVRSARLPASKLVVVPNGVPVERIEARSDAARQALLAELGRPADVFLVGTVGRLSPVKDHFILLEVVATLRRSGRAVDLVIVGDGETRAALERAVLQHDLGDCVHLLGMRADVPRLLAAMDAFVLPSLSEGYSLALVEASAAALPLVATRVGGNAEILADETTGLLVEPRDAAGIAAALARLADDPALRERLGSAGRAWALGHASIGAMGRAYDRLYQAGSAVQSRADSTPARGEP